MGDFVGDVGKTRQHNPELGIMEILQSEKTAVVTGDTATTNIPITGILVGHKIKRVIAMINNTASAIAVAFLDLTSEASITSDGNIQLSTTDTSTYRLLVEWYATKL